jgi:pyruvate/2-oxoglutarate dehydrogenase complex dihydrolipoamide acyltransferase (E2) component
MQLRFPKRIRDSFDEHQTIAEMETDKALVEVPSPWAGVVKELKGNEGDDKLVGKRGRDRLSGGAAGTP